VFPPPLYHIRSEAVGVHNEHLARTLESGLTGERTRERERERGRERERERESKRAKVHVAQEARELRGGEFRGEQQRGGGTYVFIGKLPEK